MRKPKSDKPMQRLVLAVALSSPLSVSLAQADEGWKYGAEIYGWLPDIEGNTPGGDDIKITLDDILDNLDFTFMGAFAARKGKWSLFTDVVNLQLSADKGGTGTIDPIPGNDLEFPVKVDLAVDMEAWVVNLGGSYSVYRTDRHDVQIMAGARYLWLELKIEADTSNIERGGLDIDGDDDSWDAVVGVRGRSRLGENWSLFYRADVGTGDADLTWNAAAQFAYRFSWGSVALGYRYLDYDFDSDFSLMKDMKVHGPLIGAIWEF